MEVCIVNRYILDQSVKRMNNGRDAYTNGVLMNHNRRTRIVWASLLSLGTLMFILSGPANSQGKGKVKKPNPQKVLVEFRTHPPRVRAKVEYGRKTFGYTPFSLELNKDSGFRDIRVTAKGFITLNTRFHTFKDHKRTLTLTKVEDAHTMLGYKHLPVDAEVLPVDAGSSDLDAGVGKPVEPSDPAASLKSQQPKTDTPKPTLP